MSHTARSVNFTTSYQTTRQHSNEKKNTCDGPRNCELNLAVDLLSAQILPVQQRQLQLSASEMKT